MTTKSLSLDDKRLAKYSFIIWLITFSIFVFNVYRYGDFLRMPSLTSWLTLACIPIGTVAYIIMSISLAKAFVFKFFSLGIFKFVAFILVGVIFLLLPLLSLAQYSKYVENQQIESNVDNFDKVENEPLITDEPDSTYVENSYVEKTFPTTDPDPIINCNVHTNCGGGTTQLRQSECNNSICCEVGGQWLFYNDKNKCKEDQVAYWSAYYEKLYKLNQEMGNYPSLLPLPSYSSYPSINIEDKYIKPTLSNEEIAAQLKILEAKITACKNDVNNYYNDLIRNECYIKIANLCGECSAIYECEKTYNKKRDVALSECESI